MTNRKAVFFLLLILIIASFLRLYQITSVPPGLYPDEAIGGNQGLEAFRTGNFRLFYPENNGRTGLFINLQGISAGVFGVTQPWTLRLPSAIFGILTVLGLYFLTKELFEDKILFSPKPRSRFGSVSPTGVGEQIGEDERASRWSERSGLRKNEILALLSSFLLATSFWHINFSRIGFDGILAPAFLVWAIYLLLKAIKSSNDKAQMTNQAQNPNDKNFSNLDFVRPSQPKRLLRWSRRFDWRFGFWILPILAGLVYGLGFHSYIAYRITPLLLLFVLFIYWRKSGRENWRKKFLLSTFYFLLSTFLVALPLGIYFLTHPADLTSRTSQISVFSSAQPLKDLATNILKTLAMFNFRGDSNWRHNYSDRPELFWPVGILFIIGIIIGIKSLLKNPNIKVQMTNQAQSPNDKNFSNLYFARPSQPKRLLRWSRRFDWRFGFWILFLWFALGAAPAVFSNEGLPHALRSILMAPPVFIFAAVGGIYIYDFLKKYITSFWLPVATTIFLSLLILEAYNTYFNLWAANPNTYNAFSSDYVELGRKLNSLPSAVPRYVIVKANGVLVNGIPMPAQTVMFITDTYSSKNQQLKNIHYILPDEEKSIPAGAMKFYLE